MNRAILEKQLVASGLEVRGFDCGAEALAYFKAGNTADALITDSQAGAMTGHNLAVAVRKTKFAPPIVLLSSEPTTRLSAGDRALFDATLTKPVLRREMFAVLCTLDTQPEPAAKPKQRRKSSPAKPAARAASASKPGPVKPVAAPPEPAQSARRMKVLTAEDNRTNQLVFRKMVKDLDIDLRFANNGLEAVAEFQRERPDLMFMDISMPEMDGMEATRTIRALEATENADPLTIVALTAHAMTGDDTRILAAGLSHYLTKPLRKAEIHAKITEYAPQGTCPAGMATAAE